MLLPKAIAEKMFARFGGRGGGVNVTVSIPSHNEADLSRIRQAIMENSDVMRNFGNPAVRSAWREWQDRRNFG